MARGFTDGRFWAGFVGKLPSQVSEPASCHHHLCNPNQKREHKTHGARNTVIYRKASPGSDWGVRKSLGHEPEMDGC